jgi:hypothetical protein
MRVPLSWQRAEVRSPTFPPDAQELALVAAAIALAAIALAATVALATHLLLAGWARRELRFTFPGVPRTVGEWWRVFSWNARQLGAPLAAAGLVGLRGPRPSRIAVSLELVVGVFVLVTVAVNILYVGLALGAYGLRAAWWLAPHGPVELAAYASGLAVWARALQGRLTIRLGLGGAAVSVALLAVAAAIETAVR